jgi:hypothetical protein
MALFKELSRWGGVLVMCCIFTVLYMVPNRMEPLREPTQLFLLGEGAIPFVESSILVYMSAFVLIGFQITVLVRSVTKDSDYWRVWFGALAMTVLHAVVFVGFPTEYPRPDRELSGSFTGALYALYTWADAPTNCFPSFHVAIPVYMTLSVGKQCKRWVHALMWFWTAAIAVSTVTTHQHFVLDAIGGAGISLFVYTVMKNLDMFLPYKSTWKDES